jgi:uncharacterized spore protein YtfJ
MDVMDVIEKAQDTAVIDRVFGRPITQDGVTIIPVARIAGGGGGGSGKQEGERAGEGSGGGFGLGVVPAGVFVVKEGKVRWQPVVDVNRVILGAQTVAIVALITLRTIARLRTKAQTCGRR